MNVSNFNVTKPIVVNISGSIEMFKNKITEVVMVVAMVVVAVSCINPAGVGMFDIGSGVSRLVRASKKLLPV